MKIQDLITLAENKLMVLNNDMSNAVQRGDVEEITLLESLITETQATLDTLRAV